MQGCRTDAELASAFAQWEREPALATLLLGARHGHLVLDGFDGRVRHASPEAGRLADALAGLDGGALARQLAVACPTEGGHRLARLRLDPRRISPPALFTVARATDAQGRVVFLAAPSAAITLPRTVPQPVRPAAPLPPALPAAPPPVDVALQESLNPGDRFLWGSDAAGTLTRLTGPLGGNAARLLGQAWATLIEEGRASPADSVSAAINGRRTFRRLPVGLRLGGLTVDVELSGAPTGREGAEFRGFEGFGVIRALGVAFARDEAAPALPPALPPAPEDYAFRVQEAVEAARAVEDTDEAPAVAATGMEAAPAEALDAEAVEVQPDGSLSTDEHAAFREIARALGARYAGDDEGAPDDGPAPVRMAGSIMPFPSLRPDLSPASPPIQEEGGGLLDSLPMAAIVHRGELILAVNRPFLDLVRFPDRAALVEAGLDAIFPSGAPAFRSGQSHETAIGTAGGGARPVEVTRGICVWEGGPAAILLLRSLEENDPRRELAAERLAREVQAGRALGAEAALDALQAGVVTIDRDGRVVTLNRAAAACFGASPSEIVGSSFASLFEPGSGATLDAMFAGGEAPSAVLAQGRAMTLALAPPRADGHRVAVLHRLPESTAPAPAPSQPVQVPRRPTTLARLDRELREPISAILALTTAMLEERFGALGDRRYRAGLTDIREAGKRIVERVAALSDLAAVEAGQIDLDPRPLALNELVAGCVSVLQTEAAKGRIVLRTSFSADLAELEADEASVRKAASLVIEHAIRRSVAGGQVIVSTGTGESAEVALRVRDGSPAHDEPEKAPEDEDLRLALPRALVQANGGRLRLAGRGEDGTLVEILLPVRRSLRS
jgi:PAS domain S-box-containing protein